MTKKNFDIGRIIKALTPAQGMIAASMDIVEHYKDNPETLATIKKYLLFLGVNVYQPSENITIVCWNNDLEEVLTADLKSLPEYLASEDIGVRKLAKWKLDTLTGESSNG